MRLIRNHSGSASGGSIRGEYPRRMGRSKPRPENKTPPFTGRPTPFRVNTSPAHELRIHPLARTQEKKVRKHNPRQSLEKSASIKAHSAQRRGEQLPRTLRTQEPGAIARTRSPIPERKIQKTSQREQGASLSQGNALRDRRMPSQEAIDSMRTRNMERIVRGSQARMLNERVKELFEKQPEKDCLVSHPKTEVKRSNEEDTAMVELLRMAISLGHLKLDKDSGVKDLRVSRLLTKLDCSGLRPCHSSMDSLATDHISDSLRSSHAYHMRIRSAKIQTPGELRKPKPKRTYFQEITANLIKDEQRRLNTLRAEKVQLKIIQDELKSENLARTSREFKCNSSIVDPKSCLTKVLAKNEILSVIPGNNFSLDAIENPELQPETSKSLPKKQRNPSNK
ncbi:uncharacterized protein LOC108091064 isoform X2 [Drosophila ficusphila]|nr:uncharacterized protein LOC108091064 isoform X2 [Drosophila ficusphila]